MSEQQIFTGTFTLTRLWAASPARVFDAWSRPQLKAQWFSGPPGLWQEVRRSLDVRPGGHEIAEGVFPGSGVTTLFEARYHVVEPAARLVFTYDLTLSGTLHSVTLASLALAAEGAKTRVSYTEQIVFLDGKDGTEMRRQGTEPHFERIERLIAG